MKALALHATVAKNCNVPQHLMVNSKDRQEYLQQQFYLSPHPAELMLRNHV